MNHADCRHAPWFLWILATAGFGHSLWRYSQGETPWAYATLSIIWTMFLTIMVWHSVRILVDRRERP